VHGDGRSGEAAELAERHLDLGLLLMQAQYHSHVRSSIWNLVFFLCRRKYHSHGLVGGGEEIFFDLTIERRHDVYSGDAGQEIFPKGVWSYLKRNWWKNLINLIRGSEAANFRRGEQKNVSRWMSMCGRPRFYFPAKFALL
jgi:hypothetical protein